MAGIFFNMINFFSSRLIPQTVQHVHPWNIPLPSVLHKIINSETTNLYDEILVIGDVHGCFDELQELLEIADGDKKTKILKIFVGDIVNKGPKSREALNYVLDKNREDCLSVRGNHEEKVINEWLQWKKNPSYKTDSPWMSTLTDKEVNLLIELPYTITIDDLNAIIVHAGLIPGLPLDRNKLWEMINMRNLILDSKADGGFRASKETDAGEAWASLWNGPEHIYFGHDAKRQLQQHPMATGLDSGCVYGKYLSSIFIKGPRTGQLIKVPAKKVYVPIDNP